MCKVLGFNKGNVRRKQLLVNLMRITWSVAGKVPFSLNVFV